MCIPYRNVCCEWGHAFFVTIGCDVNAASACKKDCLPKRYGSISLSIDVCSDEALHDDLIDCRAVKINIIIHSRLVNRSWVSCVSMRIYTALMSVSERPAVPQD